MSKELVPLKYDRYAHNIHHGVETRGHDDKLAPEQAEIINDTVDIYVMPVMHGYGLNDDPHALENTNAPGRDDYAQVEKVVSGMNPGDVLFAESVGFDLENEAVYRYFNENMPEVIQRIHKTHKASEEDYEEWYGAKAQLEFDKDNYLIDTIQYGVRLALLNGIKVVFADIDSYESNRLDAMTNGNRDGVGAPIDEVQMAGANSLRNRRAVNTVKDYALEMSEKLAGLRDQGDPKPKLILLYGMGHADDLESGFSNLGLVCHLLPRPENDPVERLNEHAEYAIAKAHAEHVATVEEEAYDIENRAKAASEQVKWTLFMTAKKHAALKAAAYKNSIRGSIVQK